MSQDIRDNGPTETWVRSSLRVGSQVDQGELAGADVMAAGRLDRRSP